MDINDLRGLATLLVFISFSLLCLWTLTPAAKRHGQEAAQLPFADDEVVRHD